jgi:hypothetical protein
MPAYENDFGVSFSIKYSRELGIDPKKCLAAGMKDLGFKRLRLMSYWDIHETALGEYDFSELDWQFKLAEQYGAHVSLCLGLRQPRWPESHWPAWARELERDEWNRALFDFIEAVVKRYKDHPALGSWQLENEALLKSFGMDGDFDRDRLKYELALVKNLDPNHPVIMSMSDSWGIPWHGPWPDMFGLSIYRYYYDRGAYRRSRRPAVFYRLRAGVISLITGRPVYIHELQAEPWGPQATVSLAYEEQMVTMSQQHLEETFDFARKTHLLPADAWGLEWWYWLKTDHKQDFAWRTAKSFIDGTANA